MPRKFLAASAASSSRELESWPAAFKMPVSAFEDGNTFDVPRVARFSTTTTFYFFSAVCGLREKFEVRSRSGEIFKLCRGCSVVMYRGLLRPGARG